MHFMRGWGGIIITRKENSGAAFGQGGGAVHSMVRRYKPPAGQRDSRGALPGTNVHIRHWRQAGAGASKQEQNPAGHGGENP